jgi:D-serine deaminase-like pyridoxal phosphate-dependent protein
MASQAAATEPAPFPVPEDLPTPALVVERAVADRNIADMAGRAQRAGLQFFPHAKTHRSPDWGRVQLRAGADGLTVATIAEAEAFAAAGCPRLVLAYPLIGEQNVRRAAALARRLELTLAADSVAGAKAIGQVFAAMGQTASVMLLIDSGLRRCGVLPEHAANIATQFAATDGIRLAGILTHEGSVYDANGPGDVTVRSEAAVALMSATAQSMADCGIPVGTVSMGASASARAVLRRPGAVTQLRPGIYAFNDAGQVALGNATVADCAARVATTVVSSPVPGRACIDAGSKTLSSDGLPALGTQLFPGYGIALGAPGWVLHRLSEEHGWLAWQGTGPAPELPVGTRLQIVPNHICQVFYHLQHSYVLSGGAVVGEFSSLAHGPAPLQ